MKLLITYILAVFTTLSLNSQSIYSKAYGHPKDHAVIFLHGGPGYNAVAFEVSTAQKLAEAGFYVIVYDRRGEGRSTDKTAKFTFDASIEDLDMLYSRYNIEEAALIGHSFGGILGALYAKQHPEHVKSLVLVSTPLVMQDVFSTIIETCKKIYEANADEALRYIAMLENMDKTTLEYASYSFGHALQNNFYTTNSPTNEAKMLYRDLNNNELFKEYAGNMTSLATQGFWKNENYTSIDLTETLADLKRNSIPLYGLYGKDDGLFSVEHMKNLKKIIPSNQFKYFDNSSHNVFIDRQKDFISSLQDWLINDI